MTVAEVFQEISAADFFYRNRDIAGFTSPSRSIYSTIRELVENSLDACETGGIPPDIYVRLSHESGPLDGPGVYDLRIEDNGIGVPGDVIPSAFGQVLYGSKYKLRQTRGTFGLGGKMALLYGQITTHGEAQISSSTNPKQKITEIDLQTDIQHNKPIVLKKKTRPNSSHWKGTIIEFKTEADYSRAMPRILEYFKQTAIIVPYANLTFVDPRGRLYHFTRGADLLATGIKKELGITDEDVQNGSAFIATLQRKPATYSGFPFIIEVGVASGKQIETQGKILLFRFANKIPLLFDEASDVSWKVVDQIDWRGYKVIPGETPLAIFVHVCSTKIPYKTVGKEFIADRPEVEHEILNAIREASRNLRIYLSRREHLAQEKKRVDVFEKYLPKMAQFSTKLSKSKKEPDIKPLLKGLIKYGVEEGEEEPQ